MPHGTLPVRNEGSVTVGHLTEDDVLQRALDAMYAALEPMGMEHLAADSENGPLVAVMRAAVREAWREAYGTGYDEGYDEGLRQCPCQAGATG